MFENNFHSGHFYIRKLLPILNIYSPFRQKDFRFQLSLCFNPPPKIRLRMFFHRDNFKTIKRTTDV